MSEAIKRTSHVQVVKMPKISASETSTLEDRNKIGVLIWEWRICDVGHNHPHRLLH